MGSKEYPVQVQFQTQQEPQHEPEKLNQLLQQQLNLDSVKARAITLFKAISRIIEDFDAYSRTSSTPKWHDVLGQYSMVNLELLNIMDEIKKVSKAFVVHPMSVNAENASVLPVMLSSKLLPEIEMENNLKRDQMVQGMHNLPIPMQVEKLKSRIGMIALACENAEKLLTESRKACQLGTRQGQAVVSSLGKSEAAKVLEQERMLRDAVNFGEGLRIHGDQKLDVSELPKHLSGVLSGNRISNLSDSSSMYTKGTPPQAPSSSTFQGNMFQPVGTPNVGKAAASPASGSTPFDNSTPLPSTNSPKSFSNLMSTPSPQQQYQQQSHQQPAQRMVQMSHQQLLAQQQQLRQPQGLQATGNQQFHGRQVPSGHIQQRMSQSQMHKGNQYNGQLAHFSSTTNGALYGVAQGVPTSQFGPGTNIPQRNSSPQILNEQMFNVGMQNAGGMMQMLPIQQQQQQSQQQQFSHQGLMPMQGASNFPQLRQHHHQQR